jgi:hypothetical protein
MDSKSTDFVVPLGQARSGRLVSLSAASGIILLADPVLPDLARGRFKQPAPCVEVMEGRVVVQYHRSPCSGQAVFSREPLGEIRLNVSVPWEIEFHGRLTGLSADLRGLQLRSLDVLGSANKVALNLSQPAAAGYLYISGDVQELSIRRPPDAGVRFAALGGISNLSFDGRRFDAIDGEARLASAGFSDLTAGYEIGIAGGARHVTITQDFTLFG